MSVPHLATQCGGVRSISARVGGPPRGHRRRASIQIVTEHLSSASSSPPATATSVNCSRPRSSRRSSPTSALEKIYRNLRRQSSRRGYLERRIDQSKRTSGPQRLPSPQPSPKGEVACDNPSVKEFRGQEFRGRVAPGDCSPGLPQIRTCLFTHTAPHIMNALRDGTLSGPPLVVGADTVQVAQLGPPTVGATHKSRLLPQLVPPTNL